MKVFRFKCVWLLMVFVFLFACSNQIPTQVAFSSSTPEPTVFTIPTRTELPPTQTPILTRTTAPTRTPRVTPIPPYPIKQILFNYTVFGQHSSFDHFYSDFADSKLVLYTDGQMIIPGDWQGPYQYYQKTLSNNEISLFLAKLEALGFYTLESNQHHDPTDKLYNFGNQYSKSFDGLSYCVSVNADRKRSLCVYGPQKEFLVPEMKNILRFLNEYNPQGMTIYYPDRILLSVQAGRNPDVTDLPEEAIPWPDNLSPIEEDVMYFQGDDAKEIFALFDNTISFKVFSQNGIEYTVLIEIVLPHKEITNQ